MPELEVWLCPVHSSLAESGKLEPLDNCVACLRAERDELRGDLDGISDLFPDSAPHKHPETGVSLHDDVRDALRDKQREYERAEANWRKLAAAGERERRLRQALETFSNEDDWRETTLYGDEDNYDAYAWSPPAIEEATEDREAEYHKHFHSPWKIAQAALAQPSEAARTEGA